MTSHITVNSSIIDEIDRLSLAYQKAKDYVGQINSGLDEQINVWENRRQTIQMETSPAYDYLLPKTQRINELILEAVEALCRVELLVEQITRIDPKFLHVTRSNENRVELPRSFYPNSSSMIDPVNINGKAFDSTSSSSTMSHPPGFQPPRRSPVSGKTHFKPVVQAQPPLLTPSASPSKFTPVHRPAFQFAPPPPPGLPTRQEPTIPPLMSQPIPNFVQTLPRLSSCDKEKVKLQRIQPGTIWKQARVTDVDSLSGFCVQNWDKTVKERFDRFVQELHQTYDALEKSNQLVLFKNIEIGDFGVAKCNEDQRWHRARVIMCVDLDQIQIVFIDFGILEVKSVRQFFPIDKYFTSLPAQAIACSLSEAFPPVYDGDQAAWPLPTIETFKNEVLNRIVELHFVNQEQSSTEWPLHFVRVMINNQSINTFASLRQQITLRSNQYIAEQLAMNLREQEYILFNIPITEDEIEP